MAPFACNTSCTGDEKFAGQDERGDPDWAKFGGEVNKGGGNEDFVRNGVEELPEGGHQVHFAGQIAVEPVGGGGDHEGPEGDGMPALTSHGDGCDEDGSEAQAG